MRRKLDQRLTTLETTVLGTGRAAALLRLFDEWTAHKDLLEFGEEIEFLSTEELDFLMSVIEVRLPKQLHRYLRPAREAMVGPL